MQRLEQVGPNEWRFRWPRGFQRTSRVIDHALDLAAYGREAEAEGLLRDGFRRSPEHIDLMQALGQVLFHTGRRKEAQAVLARAVEIGRTAFPPQAFMLGRDLLEWSWLENRPFLRCLEEYMLLGRYAMGEMDEAVELAKELLALNPRDDQGVRSMALSWLLRLGRDEEALSLSDAYPEDFEAETAYGRPLAFFRLGRAAEAEAALRGAMDRLPLVAAELLKARHHKPESLRPGYQTIGGADQAYYYWQNDGALWQRSQGALNWLRRVRDEAIAPAGQAGAKRQGEGGRRKGS